MVSAASMSLQDETKEIPRLNICLVNNQTSSNTAPAVQIKVRKPYTITKQRERWTEEEHKKFLEALKLYGRAWRRIKEHVGSKTAVQIRSHAQKFFSKVVHKSGGSDESSVEPIEIPPPRPKRKPSHPYPRKLVTPFNNAISVPQLPVRSAVHDLSISDQENQSPTSVLSAIGSDTPGFARSNSPTGSFSDDSSAAAASLFLSETTMPSVQDDQEHKLFEPDGRMVVKLGFAEEEARCFKLFGRTVIVMNNLDGPSSPSTGSSKSQGTWSPVHHFEKPQISEPTGRPGLIVCGGVSFPSLPLPGPTYQSEVMRKLGSMEEDQRKGFVPYKRCLAQQRDDRSPAFSGGEEAMKEKGIILSL